MKKIVIILVLPLLLLTACKKNITDINIDPKNPLNVPSYTLFTQAQRTLVNTLTSSNVNLNIFRLVMQQWQETTYTDESNYDLTTRNIPRNVWNALYRDVIKDLRECKTRIPDDVLKGDGSADPGRQQNEIAIANIMEIYAWYYLVTTYGNIPYSEALNIDNPFPKYDDAATIFNDLLTRLDAAIANLNPAEGSFDDADIVYGGDPAAWRLFANSLKLKLGMTIADSDNTKAKATVEAAVAAGVFSSNSQNAMFQYLSGPPNTNPIWVDLVQSGRQDFVACRTLADKLVALNDPRTPYYITKDAVGGYSGGTPGASSNFSTYSKPSGPNLVTGSVGRITNADFPAILMDYAEVEFLLAEAVERGYTVGGTAAGHYANAITASILYWGGTALEATTYLLQTSVAYATATGTYRQKIGEQKWLALYNRGWDAWVEWRRFDYPVMPLPVDAYSDTPLRYTYSVDEQNINQANYDAASTAIGGDDVDTQLWFDMF